MQGHIDMGGNPIINIKPFVEDDTSQASLDALKNHVINFDYFQTQRGKLEGLIKGALNRKNPDPMESNIDMDNHDIVNLRDPKQIMALMLLQLTLLIQPSMIVIQ